MFEMRRPLRRLTRVSEAPAAYFQFVRKSLHFCFSGSNHRRKIFTERLEMRINFSKVTLSHSLKLDGQPARQSTVDAYIFEVLTSVYFSEIYRSIAGETVENKVQSHIKEKKIGDRSSNILM